MNRKTFRAASTFAIILFLTFTIIQVTQASSLSTAFSDNFDGTTVDSTKWGVQENENMSGNPAYGGKVQIANSSIILSSEGSAFPCVTTAANPFPTSGDFAVVFNFAYTKISDWGNGLWISSGQLVANRDSSIQNVVLQLWANNLDYDQSAIFVSLLGKQVYRTIVYGWEPSANPQLFELEHYGTTYTLSIDGIEISSQESKLRPDTIGFGHPPAYYIPFTPVHVGSVMGGWSSFKIDFIKVLPQTSLTVHTSVSSSALGYNVDIIGKLNTAEGQPLSGKNIIFSYQAPGLTSWNYFTSATTNSGGEYSVTWLPFATGSFVVKAEWKGDESYSGASDAKNISVIRNADTSLFFVESNSTLSSLSFNASTNELSFEVSGPSGTRGYVKFLISKTLIANLTQFRVYLDGNETKFNATSTDSMQVLYFEYGHSSHQITILMPTFTPIISSQTSPSNQRPTPLASLNASPTITSSLKPNQQFQNEIVYMIVLTIAFVIIASILVTMRRRQHPKFS